MRRAEKFFTQADRDRISAAVHEAERRTSGEIVPVVVDESDRYEEAEWRAGALLGVLALSVFAAVHLLTPVWLPLRFTEWLLIIVLCFVAGMMLARFVPAVKRIFAGTELMKKRVGQRAAGVFIEEEVFATRDRTGILLFVSLTEHKVVVLGDSGINAKVQHADWQAIVDTIVDGIVQDRFVDGLVNAVGKCGALLERMGVNIRPDDRDELTDNLRVGRP